MGKYKCACQEANYCGSECQQEDWAKHKKVCAVQFKKRLEKKKGGGSGESPEAKKNEAKKKEEEQQGNADDPGAQGKNKMEGNGDEPKAAASQHGQSFTFEEALSAGNSLVCEDMLSEALQSYDAALTIARQKYGTESTEAATALISMSTIHAKRGHTSQALQVQREILRVQIEVCGPDSEEVADALFGLTDSLCRSGLRGASARNNYETALATFRRVHGENHSKVSHALMALGVLSKDEGKLDEGAQLLTRALRIQQNAPDGEDHEGMLRATVLIGDIYMSQKKQSQAAKLYEEALEMAESSLEGCHHELYARCCLKHSGCKVAMGDVDSAAASAKKAVTTYLKLGMEEDLMAQEAVALLKSIGQLKEGLGSGHALPEKISRNARKRMNKEERSNMAQERSQRQMGEREERQERERREAEHERERTERRERELDPSSSSTRDPRFQPSRSPLSSSASLLSLVVSRYKNLAIQLCILGSLSASWYVLERGWLQLSTFMLLVLLPIFVVAVWWLLEFEPVLRDVGRRSRITMQRLSGRAIRF